MIWIFLYLVTGFLSWIIPMYLSGELMPFRWRYLLAMIIFSLLAPVTLTMAVIMAFEQVKYRKWKEERGRMIDNKIRMYKQRHTHVRSPWR